MHTIRLRGPWQISRDSGGHDGDVETITLPVPISDLKSEIGRPFLFVRHFHRPSGLDAGQNVWVVIETPLELLEVRLNEAPLALTASRRFPAQQLLAERNSLSIRLRHPRSLGVASCQSALDVQLEIEDELR